MTPPRLLSYLLLLLSVSRAWGADYAWLSRGEPADRLEARIAPPAGFARPPQEAGSFGAWLRGLPLKKGRPDVLLFDGRRKGRQDAHEAVLDIDTGKRDLQQCADAVMRLRAEYLFSLGKHDAIAFNDTDGKKMRFKDWLKGRQPDHGLFRNFMDHVFSYAGTYSLAKELKRARPEDLRAGDVFIKGGFPGHAVLVLDTARDKEGRKVFLLAQSYMPAQDIHVLKDLAEPDLSPWYRAAGQGAMLTPEWDFTWSQLKRFAD